MKFTNVAAGAVIVQGLTLLGLSAANANVILTYTGNDFTTFAAPYTGSDHVTATITLASPLGVSFSGSVTPLEFSLSDGVQTLTNNSGPFTTETFDFTTNATGMITEWDVDVRVSNDISTANDPVDAIVRDEGLFGLSIALGPPNTENGWKITTAAVPEPPTVSVLGAGLLGLGLLWWRRRQKLDLAQ